MTTSRLYRTDAYARAFEAVVTDVRQDDGGTEVALDATLFYATGGGQPHDTGVLRFDGGTGVSVVGVEEEDGVVWHRLAHDADLDGASLRGSRVEGAIDFARRYRHMQRHTAQHMLSQAFIGIDARFETRAVSLTSAVCTVDLAAAPTPGELVAAEHLVNERAYADLPIRTFEIDDSELGAYPLRRPPKVHGRIRIVAIGDWETSACGGTHLSRSAQAAPIKILRLERVKGGLGRVHFTCGLEALEDYRERHEVTQELAATFSARVAEVPERVTALQEELSAARRTLVEVRSRLADAVAAEILREAPAGDGMRLVTHVIQAGDTELLRPLADALVRQAETVALLGERTEGGGVRLLFRRSEGARTDCAALLREALPHVDGRGGGRADGAQGSGTRADGLEEALAAAREAAARSSGGG